MPSTHCAASISAAALKKVIVEVKLNGSTGAFGLKLSNAQTGEGARARPERASPLPQDHPALPRRAVRTFHASLRAGAGAPEALRRARCALVAAGAPAADWAALRFLGLP